MLWLPQDRGRGSRTYPHRASPSYPLGSYSGSSDSIHSVTRDLGAANSPYGITCQRIRRGREIWSCQLDGKLYQDQIWIIFPKWKKLPECQHADDGIQFVSRDRNGQKWLADKSTNPNWYYSLFIGRNQLWLWVIIKLVETETAHVANMYLITREHPDFSLFTQGLLHFGDLSSPRSSNYQACKQAIWTASQGKVGWYGTATEAEHQDLLEKKKKERQLNIVTRDKVWWLLGEFLKLNFFTIKLFRHSFISNFNNKKQRPSCILRHIFFLLKHNMYIST